MGQPDKRRRSHCRCSVKKKKDVLKISQVSQKTLVLESLFNKVIGNQACNFIKIRLQICSFETSEIFKNTYFKEHLPTDATINERQQETRTLLGKKNESHLGNLSRGQ